jgi:hypothetical protein
MGVNWMQDVLKPVAGGTAGFVAARVLSNGLANIEPVRNVLDKGMTAADAGNTKIAANVLGIVATLGLATRVKVIRDNQGALITGMGLALTDRLLGKLGGDAGAYLSGMGEYVSQPLGEYVSQPLGAYRAMDVMEAAAGMGQYEAAAGMGETLYAAAGMGTMYATAGLGTLYAAAGLGGEADSRLKKMYAREQPPFASIQTPTDLALPVDRSMPYAKPVPDSMVTPEGRGWAGGLFSRHLFGGML